MSGYGFAVGANGYDDEDRLVNWQRTDTNLIVARHSVSGLAAANHIQDVQQTIADYPSGATTSSPTYTYVYASYIDEPVMRGDSGGLRYYHRNQQYSISALTDGGGSIVERYAYTAYGQVTFFDGSGSQISNSEISNRYTYTGREWDEGLNLYHYRSRMYDAASGRFVSRDPIRHEGSNWGLYEFLESSPNNYLDYDGKIAFALPVVIPAGIAIAALKAAAIGMGVSMFTCLMLPECLGNAKDETLRDLEDKLEDLITIRIRPIPEPKWDPVYFPPGPKNDDGDDDKRMIYHYAECGKSCVKPSDYVTDRRLISSYEPSLKEWGEMISITFIPDVRSKCKKICEYSMIDPGVSFDAMDPVRPGVRQAFLNTTICRPALTSSPPIKMPPLK